MKKLLLLKTVYRIQIIIAALSGIFLLLATYISTVQIPVFQKMIDSQESAIMSLRHRVTKDLVQGLYISEIYADRRIDLVDIRLERMMAKDKSKLEQKLLEDILNKTVEQIQKWDSLFIIEGKKPTRTPIPVFNEGATIEEKILKTDNSLTESRLNAYSRLEEIINKIQACNQRSEDYKIAVDKKQGLFRCYQVWGLIFLAVAITLESCKKYKEIE